MSIADVTARISELQAQLAVMQPAVTTAGSGAAFDGLLTQASTAATGATGVSATDGTSGATLGASSSGGSVSGADVVADARRYLGVPYVWGGTDPATGLDCSGLVQRVYADLGYSLPRVAADQASVGTAVDGLANARPGDILAFGSPAHHVGIYVGDGQMIEAPRPGLKVRVAPVYETPSSIRRVVPSTAGVSTTGVSTTGLSSLAASAALTSASGTTSVSGVPYASLFESAGRRYGVSPALLASVAQQESGFNPRAVSGAGAQGLMQLMPSTAAGLGVTNPFDPAQAVDGAARLLRGLTDTFGRTDLAVAAYNAGPGAVRRYGGVPPYPETQSYVRAVMARVGSYA